MILSSPLVLVKPNSPGVPAAKYGQRGVQNKVTPRIGKAKQALKYQASLDVWYFHRHVWLRQYAGSL